MPDIMVMDTYPLSSTTRGATCSMCHAHQLKEKDDYTLQEVYHLGVWIEMEGAFVICRSCAIQIGYSAGMILETEAKATKADVSRSQRREAAIKHAALHAIEARDSLVELVDAMNWEPAKDAV